jgi:azurin
MLLHCSLSRRQLLRSLAYASVMLPFSSSLAACGGSKTQANAVQLEVACDGNNLAFAPPQLSVQAAKPVQLTFHNVSTIFQHNWMLVNGGTEAADRVNQAATASGPDNEYLPADQSAILAYVPLTNSGESNTVAFTAPAPGEYIYLCTFPGHYLAGMQGTLVVEG